VFDSFRDAWRQAVANFWHEMHAEEVQGDARVRSMYGEVSRARNEMNRLEREIAECRRIRDAERAEADVCARRERMARDIGDVDTASIAADYRARHDERAAVLGRKLEALLAEHGLCQRDLVAMERALAEVGDGTGAAGLDDLDRHPREAEFQNLERAARDRQAAERLEELKRRGQG
jgi:hypothetical protein